MYSDNIKFRDQDDINKMFVRCLNKVDVLITNLEKEVKELKEIVNRKQENKELEEEPKDYELYVEIYDYTNKLSVGFKNKNIFYPIGYILLANGRGECQFITQEHQQDNWETWKQKGFKVAEQEPIEWQGLNWRIDVERNLCIEDDMIYGFMGKRAYSCVTEDKNFLKKDSNNRVHLY